MPGRPRTRDPKPQRPEQPVPAASASPEAPNDQVEQAPRPGPGRPSDFDPSLEGLVQRCGKANLTDDQMATIIGISPGTFYNWKAKHPEFLQWVKEGQTDKKARLRVSAYQRAFGFTVLEEKHFVIDGKVVTHASPKYYPPSDTMLIFLMCNVLPEEFRHVQHIQAGGGVDLNLKNTVPAGFLADMNRTLAAMGEAPGAAGRIPANPPATPARAPGKPGKAAAPARAKAPSPEDDDEVPLAPPDDLEVDDNPPTSLDLSGLEDGDE